MGNRPQIHAGRGDCLPVRIVGPRRVIRPINWFFSRAHSQRKGAVKRSPARNVRKSAKTGIERRRNTQGPRGQRRRPGSYGAREGVGGPVDFRV